MNNGQANIIVGATTRTNTRTLIIIMINTSNMGDMSPIVSIQRIPNEGLTQGQLLGVITELQGQVRTLVDTQVKDPEFPNRLSSENNPP